MLDSSLMSETSGTVPPGGPAGRPAEPAPRGPLPPGAAAVSLMGVDYAYLQSNAGGDLYLTRFGLSRWELLLPENWFARTWFEANRRRLVGTSTIYHTRTKPVGGRSLELVVKYSRVGEDVPGAAEGFNRFLGADFNSPFEEFALLMELRAGQHGPPRVRIRAQKPLAIYLPPEKLQLWQTGRSESRIAAKRARHPGVKLDIQRQYVLVFEWIDGLDLVQAADQLHLAGRRREEFLAQHTSLAIHELEQKGCAILDMKAAHVIVRLQPDGRLLRDRSGQVAYAVIDYELLQRTPDYERTVRSHHRRHYLERMAHRFDAPAGETLPPHLQAANLLGVDYVAGQVGSTGGLLWVVGKDPDLFNYFLPERWRRTPRETLSARQRVFKTLTKDQVWLVWKVSRLGEWPHPRLEGPRLQAALRHGFNSPFEEFAHALAMGRAGFKTVYPRAIYRTGRPLATAGPAADPRRYSSLAGLLTPHGQPALSPDHEYITLWGFWNGPDEMLAAQDGRFYRGMDLKRAAQAGVIRPEVQRELLEKARQRLGQFGFEDLNLKPDHVLISLDPEDRLIRDPADQPELRWCNFEMVRPVPHPGAEGP